MTAGTRGTDRYYTIQDADEDNFRAGSTADGRQVLLGLLCPRLVVVHFDAEGRFPSVEERPWNVPAPRMEGNGPYMIHEEKFRAALRQQFRDWHEEIGFEPGTIRVRKFFLDDHYLGIRDLPDHYEEYLADPAHYVLGEEETKEWPGMIENWRESGQFVLWWGKDYWLDADGEIGST